MPVIVVGADTKEGRAIIDGLVEPGREVRAFVSDPDVVADLRSAGVKVALGDVSDDSHVQGACTNCFTAVLVTEAARDARERSFAATEAVVLQGWADAVTSASVTRVIWVHDGDVPTTGTRESTRVAPADPDLVDRVVALDNAVALP